MKKYESFCSQTLPCKIFQIDFAWKDDINVKKFNTIVHCNIAPPIPPSLGDVQKLPFFTNYDHPLVRYHQQSPLFGLF